MKNETRTLKQHTEAARGRSSREWRSPFVLLVVLAALTIAVELSLELLPSSLSRLSRTIIVVGDSFLLILLVPYTLYLLLHPRKARVEQRRFAEGSLSRRMAYERMLSEICSCAATTDDADQFQRDCVELLGKALGVSRVSVFEYRRDTETMDNTFEWVSPGTGRQSGRLQDMPVKDFPYRMDLLRKSQVINCADVSEIPSKADRELLEMQGTKSFLHIPLYVGGNLYGFIGFDECRRKRSWPEEDVVVLKAAAAIIATAVEYRRAHEGLLKSEAASQALLSVVPDLVFHISGDGCFLAADRKQHKDYYAPPAEFLGKHMSEVLPAEVVASAMEAIKRALETGEPQTLEYPLELGGKLQQFEARIVRTDDDKVLAAVRDITGRKQAEETLRSANEMLHALVQASPMAIVTLDRRENVEFWNPEAERMFGWSGAEVIGRPLQIVSEEQREEFRANFARVIGGETLTGLEARRMRKDGSPIDIRGSIAPLWGPDGEVVGVVGMLDNVTEYKQLEAGARQSQRLEAIGRLAGSIAHEFKNLLMGISGYAEVLQVKLGRNHPQFGIINDLLGCVDRASKLIGQLRVFSTRQHIDARPTDLNKLVAESQHFLGRLLGEHISVTLDLAPDLDMVNVDPGQIEQVLVNLAINARDAMPQGGQLTISTRHKPWESADKPTRLRIKPGEYAELSIADTGVGMDEVTKDHIFEPFFTTKDPSRSAGLGLAVTYGIIKQHKGFIDVSSEIGKGATFRIYLPIAEAATATIGGSAEPEPKGGTETILLAEDEEVVRMPIKSMLEGYGYTVLCASNGEEAMELFNRHGGDVALVILDLVMPKAGGKCIWRAMSEARPGLKAIFISGHATVHQDFTPPSHMPFLSKPFSAMELAAKIRDVLG